MLAPAILYLFGSPLEGAAGIGVSDLVDDLLDEDDANVDAAGEVGEEFGDEVVSGGEGEAVGVAFCGGMKVCSLAGDVEIGDFEVDGEANDVGVIQHAFAIVALRPENLGNAVKDAALDGGAGHAVVVRVLVDDGGNEESAEEFAGHIFAVADAHHLCKAVQAGPVGGMGVGANGDGGVGKDRDSVERVEDVLDGETGFFFGREGLDFRSIDEALIEVNDGHRRARRKFHWREDRSRAGDCRRLWLSFGRRRESSQPGDETGSGLGDGDAGGLAFRNYPAWTALRVLMLDDWEGRVGQRAGGADGV